MFLLRLIWTVVHARMVHFLDCICLEPVVAKDDLPATDGQISVQLLVHQ